MALPDITLRADFDNNGVYEADLSPYLQGYEVKQGRRSAVDHFPAPRATLELDNEDSRFSPKNAAGAYYPDLGSDQLTRVQLLTSRTVAAITNLLLNPSVGTNLTGWTAANAALSRDADAGRVAQYGVKVLESGAAAAYWPVYTLSGTPSQVAYTASIYVRGVGDSIGKPIQLALNVLGGAGGPEASAGSVVNLTVDWQRLTVTHTVVAADHTSMTLEAKRTADFTASEYFYADAAQLETAASASEFIDGDQPACSWSGTAHASASSRGGNPTHYLFTGILRDISLARPFPGATFEATGLTESLLRHRIYAGPFGRKPASLIIQRLIDVMDNSVLLSRDLDGEIFWDGAFRVGGTPLISLNGTTIDNTYDTGLSTPSTYDPEEYTAMEGDNVSRCSGIDADGDGWTVDVTADTDNLTLYRFACFLKGVGGSIGKDVDLVLEGLTPAGGTGASGALTLTAQWQHVELVGTFDAEVDLSTVRRIRVQGRAGEGWGSGGPYEFLTDCIHMTGAVSVVAPGIGYSIDGANFAAEIEYLDAIDRSAGAVLDELSKSVGGWFREDGQGRLVFEDFGDRAPDLLARLRLTDNPIDGGHAYGLTDYREPTGSLANQVRVGSYGDVTVIQSLPPVGLFAFTIRILWSLEPVPRTILQDAVHLYRADYAAEGDELAESQSSLILRRGIAGTYPTGSWGTHSGVQTPYVLNFGRGGIALLQGQTSGSGTLYWLAVGGRLQQRNTSERSFVATGDGEPVMELDMPAQGFQTALMTSVMNWASTKYGKGPPTISLKLEGNADPARLDHILSAVPGLPVYFRHKLGPYAFMLDGRFFVEAVTLRHDPEGLPSVTLDLEEA